MGRKRMLLLAFPAAGLGSEAAWGQAASSFGMQDSMMGSLLRSLTEKLAQIFASLPALGDYLAGLPLLFSWQQTALLLGIVVVGLAAEWLTRVAVQRLRVGIFERHAGESPLRAFFHGALLDALALLALGIAAALMARHAGAEQGVYGKVAHQLLVALLYWRGFNFVFRIWLRPNTPEGRIAPVDDATAARLLVGLNVVIVLPLLLRQMVMFMQTTGAAPQVLSAAVILAVPVVEAGLVYAVWHWRHEMGAWLAGMVNPRSTFHAMKVGFAHSWWAAGLVFYLLSGVAAILAAVTESAAAMHGIARVESMLILLLLFETLIHRLTHPLPCEVPTVADVFAGLVRLALRLVVLVIAADALLLGALGIMEASEWAPFSRSIRLAAISTFATYAVWRFV